ncbi:tetratricopeptide repeat protein [Pyxidicoccus sp. 3LFB2]
MLEDLFKLYLTAGNPEAAKRTAMELRQLVPANVNYVYLHGLAMMSAGAFRESQALFEEVVRLAPGSWQALQALSQVHLALQERGLARKRLEEAVALVPTELGPANDLAMLFLQDEANDRALPVLERVLEAHPEDAGTHLNMAVAWFPTDKAACVRHAKQAFARGTGTVREQAERLLRTLGG